MIIIDDGDLTGVSMSDGWTAYQGQGYNNTIHRANPGDGSVIFTWNFQINTPGVYQVLTTWSPHQNRANDVTYTVLNTYLDWTSELVNQQQEPGIHWKFLGYILTYVVPTIVLVQLTNKANGFVCADAMMLNKVESPASIAF